MRSFSSSAVHHDAPPWLWYGNVRTLQYFLDTYGIRVFRSVNFELVPCSISNKCDKYGEINEYVATKRPFLVHILHLTIATFK